MLKGEKIFYEILVMTTKIKFYRVSIYPSKLSKCHKKNNVCLFVKKMEKIK